MMIFSHRKRPVVKGLNFSSGPTEIVMAKLHVELMW